MQKLKVALPETVSGIIHCKNPRCITTVEPSVEQLFYLADREKKIYRCRYCDTERK